jgi:hypothetical protein
VVLTFLDGYWINVVAFLSKSTPSIDLKFGFAGSTSMAVSASVPGGLKNAEFENALAPMVVTLAGMVTEVSLLAPTNACCPILASLEPDSNVIVVSPDWVNAESPRLVTFAGMVMALRANV